MHIITWKNSDLSGRAWDFEANSNLLGKLEILSSIGFNANFKSDNSLFEFRRAGFWGNKILIIKDGVDVGEIQSNFFGSTLIQVDSGQTFRLSSNLFGRNLKCIDTKGKSVVEYKMATLASMRRGSIQMAKTLSIDEMEILLSAGLIAGHFKTWRFIFLVISIASTLSVISYLVKG
ncbi:MAG: hypothetical protein KF687_13565 [Cyclobacteriaceae bacterium]|nr:hypothetical protein [Cyclobacteriaceae bacterium]